MSGAWLSVTHTPSYGEQWELSTDKAVRCKDFEAAAAHDDYVAIVRNDRIGLEAYRDYKTSRWTVIRYIQGEAESRSTDVSEAALCEELENAYCNSPEQ